MIDSTPHVIFWRWANQDRTKAEAIGVDGQVIKTALKGDPILSGEGVRPPLKTAPNHLLDTIEDLTRRVSALESLARMEAAQDLLNTKPEPRKPPESVVEAVQIAADILEEYEAHGSPADQIGRAMAKLTNKRMMDLMTDEDRAKEKRLQEAITWFGTHRPTEVV